MRPQRMPLRQLRVILIRVHRRVHRGGRDGVEADVVRRVLDRQRLAHRWHGRLRQHGQQRPRARLVGHHRGDVHDMPRALLLHRRHDLLRHEEVARNIRAQHAVEIVLRVIGERLRNVNARVVHEQVDAAKLLQRRVNHRNGGRLLARLAVDQDELRRGLQLLRLRDRA